MLSYVSLEVKTSAPYMASLTMCALGFLYDAAAAAAAAAKSLQSCPTLCDPIDGSPPGFAAPGIHQARTLEWLPFPSPSI